MDSGYYAANDGTRGSNPGSGYGSGQSGERANAGYRAEREFFRSSARARCRRLATGRDREQLRAAGRRPAEHGPGRTRATGNPLDLAIEGQGFFMVQTPNGPRYTRDGTFHRAQNGQLVTQRGEPVISQAGPADPHSTRRSHGGRRRSHLGRGGVVAQVGVFAVSCRYELTPEGANRYVAPQGTKATAATGASIHEGALEAANQDVVQGSLRSGHDAAPGGDDATRFDGISHRVQQVCD